MVGLTGLEEGGDVPMRCGIFVVSDPQALVGEGGREL
jgi:hypothetical protein